MYLLIYIMITLQSFLCFCSRTNMFMNGTILVPILVIRSCNKKKEVFKTTLDLISSIKPKYYLFIHLNMCRSTIEGRIRNISLQGEIAFEVNKIEIRGKNLGPFCPSSHDGLRLTGGPNAIRQITRTQYNTTKVNNGRVDQVSALNHKVMLDHVILQGKVLLYLLACFSNLGRKKTKIGLFL